MDDDVQKFYIAEYAALRSQLVDLYKTSNNWMIYVISANFFLVAWTAKAACNTNKLCQVTAWLPLIITLIGLFLYRIHARTIAVIISYLAVIEGKFDTTEGGFGKFFDKETRGCVTSTKNIMWIIYDVQLIGAFIFLFIFEQEMSPPWWVYLISVLMLLFGLGLHLVPLLPGRLAECDARRGTDCVEADNGGGRGGKAE